MPPEDPSVTGTILWDNSIMAHPEFWDPAPTRSTMMREPSGEIRRFV
jgi:hypothetical protein